MRRGIFLTSAILSAMACGMSGYPTEAMPIKMAPIIDTASSRVVIAKPRRRETRGGHHRNKRRSAPGPRKFKKRLRYSSPSWGGCFKDWIKELYSEARKTGYHHSLDASAYRIYFEDGYSPRAAWLEDLSQA